MHTHKRCERQYFRETISFLPVARDNSCEMSRVRVHRDKGSVVRIVNDTIYRRPVRNNSTGFGQPSNTFSATFFPTGFNLTRLRNFISSRFIGISANEPFNRRYFSRHRSSNIKTACYALLRISRYRDLHFNREISLGVDTEEFMKFPREKFHSEWIKL